MTTPSHDALTRRRVILGAARGLAACPMVAAAGRETGEDAPLVRDCREFDALERRGQAICSSGDSVEEDLACERAIGRIAARQAPILRRIVETRARTGGGLRAKAASLALWDQNMFETETTCWNRLLVCSLVTDMLAMAPDRMGETGT